LGETPSLIIVVGPAGFQDEDPGLLDVFVDNVHLSDKAAQTSAGFLS
jgi:hypothetical protein